MKIKKLFLAFALISCAPLALTATEQNTEEAQQATYEERFEGIVQRLAQASTFMENRTEWFNNIESLRRVVAFCNVVRNQLFDLMREVSANLTPEKKEFAQRLLDFTQTELYTDLVQSIDQLLERIKELEAQNS